MMSIPLPKFRPWIPLAMVTLGFAACTHLEEDVPLTGGNLDSEPRFNQTQATTPSQPAPVQTTSTQTSAPTTPGTPAAPDPRDELKNLNPDTTTQEAPVDPAGSAGQETASDNGAGQSPVAPAADPEELPFGIPVPGRPGTVYSPYDRTAGFVDVSGMAPGTVVTDPYSGNKFRVP